jgi:membrane-bound lytic murein transglycosylase MltF
MAVVLVRLVLAVTAATLISTPFVAGSIYGPSQPESIHQAAAKPRPEATQPTGSLELPISFERQVGDLAGMVKRHQIRALVVPSRSGFFYDMGRPQGIYYEALDEFQRFVNQKLKTDTLRINVTFIPVRPEQLEYALSEGVGDVVAYGVIVTPERQNSFLLTTPIYSKVKQVIVTGPKASAISTLEDLSGKAIFVNPLTAYFENLQRLSASLEKAGKAPILVKLADPNLTDEDLLEMVNAGLVPATVTLSVRAEFWSKVLPQLTVHPNIVLKEDGHLAWATRKDSPELEKLLDEFISTHQMGTSFGNTLIKRYLRNTTWLQDSSSSEEMKKFNAYVRYFKKYAAEYGFDYLMLVAQGYQESLLDQSRKNPSGAVGIMQVIPKYAAAPPINISNVEIAENNIQAGAKMMHNISESYFNDVKLDPLNRTLMCFAAYNAGPTRIAHLREKAASEGLDPDKWFGNVELIVAKEVGQETTQYVNNIFKYYVAYKLILEESKDENEQTIH